MSCPYPGCTGEPKPASDECPACHRRISGCPACGQPNRALARLLLASPPPQLLVLDEPSNNLDTRSVDHLVHALRGYRGALLVVSHDDSLLARLNLTTTLALDRSGNLSAVHPTA